MGWIVTAADDERIIAAYRSGRTYRQIVKELGFSDKYIRKVLKNSGVEIRGRGAAGRSKEMAVELARKAINARWGGPAGLAKRAAEKSASLKEKRLPGEKRPAGKARQRLAILKEKRLPGEKRPYRLRKPRKPRTPSDRTFSYEARRLDGCPMKQIAEEFGVTRQAISSALANLRKWRERQEDAK